MARTRFVMVGGFLGAGKTTTIARLARDYKARGLNVGIVTNDQATDLVDTHSLLAQGFAVGEVPGACFCCNFNDLTETVGRLEEKNRPDVILAEPVGSCTDLVATVIQPLRQLFAHRFDIAPFSVLLKPSHGRRILRNEPNAGFSPKAAYIFRKQLEEADVILLNRIDELSAAEVEELTELVATEQPGIPMIRISAKSGAGFDALADFLDQRGGFGRRILELDYDTYAEGEAELGWLNSSLRFVAPEPFDLDELLLELVTRLRGSLAESSAETAHLKTIGLWEGFYGVANLVSSKSDPELSLASNCRPREVNLIVNARVATDPTTLENHVRRAIESARTARQARVEYRHTQSFRPGRPVPTHRFAVAL